MQANNWLTSRLSGAPSPGVFYAAPPNQQAPLPNINAVPGMPAPTATPAPTAVAPTPGSGITNDAANTQNLYQNGVPIQSGWSAQAPLSSTNFNSGNNAALSQMLMRSAAGNGPSAAQAQLQQATDANIRNAMAMGQSMPGQSNMSAQRNILENQAMAQQQSANQSAQLRAQEQQAAMGQAMTQNLDLSKLGLQQAQGNQQAVQQANALNEDIGKANMQAAGAWQNTLVNAGAGAAQGLAGLIGLNSTGTAANAINNTPGGTNSQIADTAPVSNYTGTTSDGTTATVSTSEPVAPPPKYTPISVPQTSTDDGYAHGGLVRGYDEGGPVGNFSSPDLSWNSTAPSMAGLATNGRLSSMSGVLNPSSGMAQGPYGTVPGAHPAAPGADGKGYITWNADGTKQIHDGAPSGPGAYVMPVLNTVVGGLFSSTPATAAIWNTGRGVAKTEGAPGAARGGLIEGGKVPGSASVSGNSPKNDTVPAMLSPGEIVLPRSVVQDPEAEEKAAQFVAAIKARRRGKAA